MKQRPLPPAGKPVTQTGEVIRYAAELLATLTRSASPPIPMARQARIKGLVIFLEQLAAAHDRIGVLSRAVNVEYEPELDYVRAFDGAAHPAGDPS